MSIILAILLLFAWLGPLPKDAPTRILYIVGIASVWALLLWVGRGTPVAAQFISGYILEWALSLDNLLAFWIVFRYFDLGEKGEARVLKIGLVTAVVARFLAAVIGATAIHAFFPIMQGLFAIFIAYTGYKIMIDNGTSSKGPDVERMQEKLTTKLARFGIPYTSLIKNQFFYQDSRGVNYVTPMFIALGVIEITDILFSVDSIPTVIAVSKSPLVIFSASMFAVMGLRAAYTLVSQGLFKYDTAIPIGIILFFIAAKLGIEAVFHYTIGPIVTVLFILGIFGLWLMGTRYEKEIKNDVS